MLSEITPKKEKNKDVYFNMANGSIIKRRRNHDYFEKLIVSCFAHNSWESLKNMECVE